MATWTFGPQSFANTDDSQAAIHAADVADTIPREAAIALTRISNAYSTNSGPAFTISGSGETDVNGSFSISIP